jgi:hypothetical protein
MLELLAGAQCNTLRQAAAGRHTGSPPVTATGSTGTAGTVSDSASYMLIASTYKA